MKDYSQVKFQLQKLSTKYPHLFNYHQWPSENDRWVELLFALIIRVTKKPEIEVRELLGDLKNWGVLSTSKLIEIHSTHPDDKWFSHVDVMNISDYLQESGFTKKEVETTLQIIKEASLSLQKNFNGKIQTMLRSFGEEMLEKMMYSFDIKAIQKDDIKSAFSYWLQNALNIPISIKTPDIDAFCKKYDLSYGDLTQASDELDINLALVDDLIEKYMTYLSTKDEMKL